MTHRIPAVLAAYVGLFLPVLAGATTVVVGTNISLSGSLGIGDFQLSVFQDAAATDFTCALFDFDGTNVNFVAGCLDEGSDWYLVMDTDAFSRSNIAEGMFTALFVNLSSSGPVPVGPGSFFLGVRTGLGFDADAKRDVFGWIELSISGTDLIEVSDTVAYGAEGIVVGTPLPIPEPGTAVLLGIGLVGMAARRRRA